MDNLVHIPVMLNECINALNIKSDGIFFDGTLGGGGHSYEILKKSFPNGKLIATDLDQYAILKANERLKEFEGRYTLVNNNFKNFNEIKNLLNIDKFDGVLLDLGVSSFQLDDKTRGFSYMSENEKLDMRMNKESSLTAEKIVNEYSEQKIKEILLEFGEEKFAANIAKNIVLERQIKKIETIKELNSIIDKSIPYKFKQNGHPSKKTFQALRIEVNGELNSLYETIIEMIKGLKKGGRIVILTFQSLEDRIVKRAFKEMAEGYIGNKNLALCAWDKEKQINIITRHPIVASENELKINSRAKSAKLRIAEKIV